MPFTIRRVEYYYTLVKDKPGEAYKLLNLLASTGVNQLAFSAIPVGPDSTQLSVFPEEPAKLVNEAGLRRKCHWFAPAEQLFSQPPLPQVDSFWQAEFATG